MSDAVVKAKFLTLAVPAVGETRAAQIVAFVDALEEQANLGPLLQACRAQSDS
jgi:hypothetical protein